MNKYLVCVALLGSFSASAYEYTWTHSGENVTRFELWGNAEGDSESVLIASLPGDARSFNFELPTDCTRYFAFIFVYNDEVISDPSNIVGKSIPCPKPPPATMGNNHGSE